MRRNEDGRVETDEEQRVRISRTIARNMDVIDQAFMGMYEQEKKIKKEEKKKGKGMLAFSFAK